MASEYELLANIIAKDRFFMEVDEYGFGELLTDILRLCHDFDGIKWDANDLAGMISATITGYVTGTEIFGWPEELGSGYVDWEKVDAEAKDMHERPTIDPETVSPQGAIGA